jgi:eukaryotic-like serine/threonine-protein kinase
LRPLRYTVTCFAAGLLLAGSLAACGAAAVPTAAPLPTIAATVAAVATTAAPASATPAPTAAPAAATAGVTAAATTGATAASTGPLTSTEVIKYQPSAPSGETREGSCFTESLALPRQGVYRCSAGNQILDPCFASTDGKSAVCGADPTKDQPGFTLKITEPLPTPGPQPAPTASPSQAWMVRLEDGTICGLATGATTGVGDKRLNYLCAGYAPGAGLLGDLVPGTIWTAEKATIVIGQNGPVLQSSEQVRIRTVWQ